MKILSMAIVYTALVLFGVKTMLAWQSSDDIRVMKTLVLAGIGNDGLPSIHSVEVMAVPELDAELKLISNVSVRKWIEIVNDQQGEWEELTKQYSKLSGDFWKITSTHDRIGLEECASALLELKTKTDGILIEKQKVELKNLIVFLNIRDIGITEFLKAKKDDNRSIPSHQLVALTESENDYINSISKIVDAFFVELVDRHGVLPSSYSELTYEQKLLLVQFLLSDVETWEVSTEEVSSGIDRIKKHGLTQRALQLNDFGDWSSYKIERKRPSFRDLRDLPIVWSDEKQESAFVELTKEFEDKWSPLNNDLRELRYRLDETLAVQIDDVRKQMQDLEEDFFRIAIDKVFSDPQKNQLIGLAQLQYGLLGWSYFTARDKVEELKWLRERTEKLATELKQNETRYYEYLASQLKGQVGEELIDAIDERPDFLSANAIPFAERRKK